MKAPLKKPIKLGFTLVELIIAFALASLLLLSAIMSWSGRDATGQSAHWLSRIASTLQLARSRAILTQTPVEVCLIAQTMWMSPHQAILTLDAPYQVEWIGSFGQPDCVTFMPSGGSHGQRGHVTLTRSGQVAGQVVLVESGRVRIVSAQALLQKKSAPFPS